MNTGVDDKVQPGLKLPLHQGWAGRAFLPIMRRNAVPLPSAISRNPMLWPKLNR